MKNIKPIMDKNILSQSFSIASNVLPYIGSEHWLLLLGLISFYQGISRLNKLLTSYIKTLPPPRKLKTNLQDSLD